MRIAQIAPLYENVPPTGYGGTERVIAGLCDGLVAAGHDVTLFATGRSQTSARLVSFIEAPLRERMDAEEMAELGPHLHMRMLTDIYARSDDFDVIHAHTDVWTLPFAELSETPTVITMHGRLDIALAQRPLSLYPGAALVSISDHQRFALEDYPVDWLATIPNGLDLDAYHRQERGGGTYLAFVGRLCPEKRPDLAVEIAAEPGGRCGSPPRSTPPTRTTSTSTSRHFSTLTTSTSSASWGKTTSRRSMPVPRPHSSPATGPNRSDSS